MRGTIVVWILVQALPFGLSGQTVLTGEVFDSLRTGRGIPGAQVVVIGTSVRTSTDERGGFALSGRFSGRVALAFSVPWMDSLGIEYIRREVELGPIANGPIRLATPSLETYQRMRCGVTLPPAAGLLIGRVTDIGGASVARQPVWATWRSLSVLGVNVASDAMAVVDTTDAAGWFTLCGVPTEETVLVRAAAVELASGAIPVMIRSAIERTDLVVSRASDLVELRGILVGRPSVDRAAEVAIVGAEIGLLDDSTETTRTDARGGFRLRVPRRSASLTIRAIGHPPTQVTIPILSVVDSEWRIEMPPLPTLLAATNIRADRQARERADFEARRRLGVGRFLSEEEIRRIPILTASAIRGRFPGVAAVGSGRYVRLRIRSGNGYCDPRFFEDGLDIGRIDALEQDALFRRAKRMEIYSATQAPAEFNDFDGCGAVVIWTR